MSCLDQFQCGIQRYLWRSVTSQPCESRSCSFFFGTDRFEQTMQSSFGHGWLCFALAARFIVLGCFIAIKLPTVVPQTLK